MRDADVFCPHVYVYSPVLLVANVSSNTIVSSCMLELICAVTAAAGRACDVTTAICELAEVAELTAALGEATEVFKGSTAVAVTSACCVSVDWEGTTPTCGGTTDVCGVIDCIVVIVAALIGVDIIGLALAIGVEEVAGCADGASWANGITSDELAPELLVDTALEPGEAIDVGETIPTMGSKIRPHAN